MVIAYWQNCKNRITHSFFGHSKLSSLAQPLHGLWHATCLPKAFNDAVHCSGVGKGTTWLCFAVFFPVKQLQAYEKDSFCQFSLPIRTGGCTASSKRYKMLCIQGGKKGRKRILWEWTEGQKQLRFCQQHTAAPGPHYWRYKWMQIQTGESRFTGVPAVVWAEQDLTHLWLV